MKNTKCKNNKIVNNLKKIVQEYDKRQSDKYQRHRNKSTKSK